MERRPRPSPLEGLRRTRGLGRLVVACWLVSQLCMVPARWIVNAAARPLAELPATEVPPGDAMLILVDGLAEVATPLRLAVLSALLTLWAWRVLWHAGVVNWVLWSGGRRLRLAEVLGLGMVSWWRYARLSLTAWLVLTASLLTLWLPLWAAISASFSAMAEGRMMLLLVVGVAASVLIAVVVWVASLHGAWLLGLPERRSVMLAWLGGLVGALKTPVATFGTLLVWAVPAIVFALLPLLLGFAIPASRGGAPLLVVSQLAALARAACWVGLFCSFAPVTGLLGEASATR